jgi:hypothetical protein
LNERTVQGQRRPLAAHANPKLSEHISSFSSRPTHAESQHQTKRIPACNPTNARWPRTWNELSRLVQPTERFMTVGRRAKLASSYNATPYWRDSVISLVGGHIMQDSFGAAGLGLNSSGFAYWSKAFQEGPSWAGTPSNTKTAPSRYFLLLRPLLIASAMMCHEQVGALDRPCGQL